MTESLIVSYSYTGVSEPARTLGATPRRKGLGREKERRRGCQMPASEASSKACLDAICVRATLISIPRTYRNSACAVSLSFSCPHTRETGIQRENETLTTRLQALSVELEKEKKKTTVVNRPAADAIEEASGNKEPSVPLAKHTVSVYFPPVVPLVLSSEPTRMPVIHRARRRRGTC